MSKRVGLFINGHDSKNSLEAGQSDVNRLFKAMTSDDIGNCCGTLSEKHLSIDTEDKFISILNALLKKLDSTDQFIFYFSGHGEIDGIHYYLKFGEESYFFETFHTVLKGKKINNAIIIIDACFSGEVAKTNNKLILNENLPEGIAILTSSTEEEFSHENDSKTFSVFTELLCECIETGNNGQKTTNNVISIPDIIDYVAKNNNHYKKQRPKHKISNSTENIWISKNITKCTLDEKQSIAKKVGLSDIEIINYNNCSFTEKLNDLALAEDLNWDLIKKYITNNEIPLSLEQSEEFILSKLGFLKHNKLLNSVIINFSERPERFIPQAFVVASLNKIHREKIFGSLSSLLDKSVTYILSKLEKYSDFSENGLRNDDFVIPKILVREIISNALTHRCYDDKECNTPVKIVVSTEKEQLEITSPGNFLGNLDDILNDENSDFSFLRDPRMGDFATSLGIAEVLGRGFDYIREYRKEHGDDFIQFINEETHLKIIIKFRALMANRNSTFEKKQIPTISLTKKLGMNNKSFLGRNRELDELDEILNKTNVVLINGIGGIGKSSLVSNYITLHKEEYNYVGYIVVEENIKSNFIAKLRDTLELKKNNTQDTFSEAISKLIQLDGKKLLIIDDLRYSESFEDDFNAILDLQNHNYTIIFTSRIKLDNIINYSLSTLKPDVALKLFLDYHESNDIERVQQILSFIDYHPLFIELITKTINSEGYTLDEIINKFNNNELSEIKFINESNGYEANLNETLKELFSMQKLEKPYELLLKKLSIFPSIEIDISFLQKILKEEHLSGKLNFLVARGWLIQHNSHFKLHQIIKEYVLTNHLVKFTEIEDIIDSYNNLFRDKLETFHQDNSIYFNSITRVIDLLDIKNEKIAIFYDNIGDIYYYVGSYVLALECYKKSHTIYTIIFDEKHELTFMAYNNIALMYDKLGKNQKALGIYITLLATIEKYYPEDIIKTGVIYGHIATIYQKLNDVYNAKKYLSKSIKLLEQNQNMETLDIATYYNNLAMIHKTDKEYPEALMYFKKSAALNIKLGNEFSENTTTVYDNMAVLHINLDKKEEALDYIKKSLRIKLDLFDENHPEIAITYFLISHIYMEYKECHKAKYYAQKSVDIFTKITTYVHPNLKIARNIIKHSLLNIKKQKKATFKKKDKYCVDSKNFIVDL